MKSQTVSDMVDCRRGGQVEHSLVDVSELPVGLKSNWAIRVACAPWLIPPLLGRAQNEPFRLALRLWLLFMMLVMIKLWRRQVPCERVWCWGFLHSKSSQHIDCASEIVGTRDERKRRDVNKLFIQSVLGKHDTARSALGEQIRCQDASPAYRICWRGKSFRRVIYVRRGESPLCL